MWPQYASPHMVSEMANSTHGCCIRATEHTDLITEMLLSQGFRIEGVDNSMIGASDIRHVCAIADLCDLTKKKSDPLGPCRIMPRARSTAPRSL